MVMMLIWWHLMYLLMAHVMQSLLNWQVVRQ